VQHEVANTSPNFLLSPVCNIIRTVPDLLFPNPAGAGFVSVNVVGARPGAVTSTLRD